MSLHTLARPGGLYRSVRGKYESFQPMLGLSGIVKRGYLMGIETGSRLSGCLL